MATTPKEIGNIFKEARKKLNLSVEDAYRQSRIHPSVINDIENGVFDRIGKLYVKSFLKKYSATLGLNTENIMKKYESIAFTIPAREFDLGVREKEEKNEVLGVFMEKKLQTAFAVILAVVLAALVVVLIGMMRSKVLLARRQKEAAVLTREVAAVPVKTRKTISKRTAPAARVSTPVSLTLKARGKVWVQITRGENTLFAGILKKGDSKTWKSDGTLTVWTGKGEMLDFVVNKRRVGKVAAGVVKNIKVSSSGVKIGDAWITRLK